MRAINADINSTPLNECEAEDCINRDYTAKYVEEFANNEYVSEDEAKTIYLIADGIRHIPSVYPKSDKPSGKWIDKEHFVGCSGSAECSVCHERISVNPHDNGFSLEYIFPKYCPNCGAKMVESQESEDT